MELSKNFQNIPRICVSNNDQCRSYATWYTYVQIMINVDQMNRSIYVFQIITNVEYMKWSTYVFQIITNVACMERSIYLFDISTYNIFSPFNISINTSLLPSLCARLARRWRYTKINHMHMFTWDQHANVDCSCKGKEDHVGTNTSMYIHL